MKKITAIEIQQLNGRGTVRLPFRDGHCIIVGPNGSGKSTALQIISLALGRQWKQLSSLRFEALVVEFGSEKGSLSRSACASVTSPGAAGGRFGRIFRVLMDNDLFNTFELADLADSTVAERFQAVLRIPKSELRSAQRYARLQHEDKPAQAEVSKFQKMLDDAEVPKTLYLPTSRRIEFDISRYTERMSEYAQREFTSSLKMLNGTDYFEEVLRFGMDDIQSMIAEFERKTRDYSRNRFNKMMSSYIKEMANSQAISITDLRSYRIDQSRVEAVLSRIEEGILSVDEKAEIGSIVVSMAGPQKGGHPPFHKRWLAHFFVRLLEVDADIEQRELPIRNLVRDLEKYLVPKRASYDIESYHFAIYSEEDKELRLGELSSGEKQLISLLSILQFSSNNDVNVFIDEPELSLSVPWQSDFLPDIVNSPSCNQLMAVTHSPFIYENSLASSVVDFLECTSS